jgi:hypothetical protein
MGKKHRLQTLILAHRGYHHVFDVNMLVLPFCKLVCHVLQDLVEHERDGEKVLVIQMSFSDVILRVKFVIAVRTASEDFGKVVAIVLMRIEHSFTLTMLSPGGVDHPGGSIFQSDSEDLMDVLEGCCNCALHMMAQQDSRIEYLYIDLFDLFDVAYEMLVCRLNTRGLDGQIFTFEGLHAKLKQVV